MLPHSHTAFGPEGCALQQQQQQQTVQKLPLQFARIHSMQTIDLIAFTLPAKADVNHTTWFWHASGYAYDIMCTFGSANEP